MADCDPLISAAFLNIVTGADIVSDPARVDAVIIIVSTLIGEENGNVCIVPAAASMKLRVVCAQYTSYVLGSGTGTTVAERVRAEQIGDYRVEYQNRGDEQYDLQLLRDMLNAMYGQSTYTINTMADKTSNRVDTALWEQVTT